MVCTSHFMWALLARFVFVPCYTDDERKLKFTLDALQHVQDPFKDQQVLEDELIDAAAWVARRSVEQVFTHPRVKPPNTWLYMFVLQVWREREAIMAELEARAAWFW